MHRFFVQSKLNNNITVRIEGDDYQHLKNSLRIRTGELIEICDGCNNTFIASVGYLNKNYCEALLQERIPLSNEPGCKITLYPAVLKGDRFESMIQKCVEGGVYAVKPVITSNTIVDISSENAVKKHKRWSRVCKLACMQSKRDILVNIDKPVKLFDAVMCLQSGNNLNNNDSKKESKRYRREISFVCHEAEEEHSIDAILEKAFGEKVENINIFIGPEGGFQEQEIERLNEYGILSVHMGKRILRADTAAYSAVFYTAMRYELNRVNQ